MVAIALRIAGEDQELMVRLGGTTVTAREVPMQMTDDEWEADAAEARQGWLKDSTEEAERAWSRWAVGENPHWRSTTEDGVVPPYQGTAPPSQAVHDAFIAGFIARCS